ncbi:unnamed protein product [Rhizoctonia solani]|uniref:Protein kinase domain-containing protein n=1 Tax=Rhizoctonia solani TaxID=456999 RepID=A0A8H2WW30_9AGAM|nr:unnamed protein product [Rhizoctonia solani]
MATLQIVGGALQLAGINIPQTNACSEFGSSLWLLCISPLTCSRLQKIATDLLQLNRILEEAISQNSARIGAALVSVLRPLSSVLKDPALNEMIGSLTNNHSLISSNNLLRAIENQVALIKTDSRCHNPVWIEQEAENALQPYVQLTKLFQQLLVPSRGHRSNPSERVDELPRILTTGTTLDANLPISADTTLVEPVKDPTAPSTHQAGVELPHISVQVDNDINQGILLSKNMSAGQIFDHLVKRGCQDLTSAIDSNHFSSEVVACGNFGDIWKGKLNDGTDVAIKVWRLTWLTTDKQKSLKRLMRELYNWSKAKHINIHQLLGVIMFQGRVGMVSKWMPNGNLQEYLSEHPSVDRYQLCVQVSKGMHYLHANNMIHGDLKATNVLVSSEGVAKLTDFDHSIISNCSLVFSATTQTGGGTLRWMAPELLSEDTSMRNKQTDIYALGMTLMVRAW